MLLAFAMLAAAETTSSPQAVCEASAPAMQAEVARGAPGPYQREGKIVVSARQPFCNGWTVVTILSSRSSEGRWIFRRARLDSRASEPTISWASSRTCPPIFAALESLEALPIRFGLGRPIRPPTNPDDDIPRIPRMLLDGVTYTVQTHSPARQPSGYTASVLLSSNAGEVATWAKTMLDSTATCWTKDEPVGQSR